PFLFLLPFITFGQLRVLDNIEALENDLLTEADEVVFIKGYKNPGDGGEGFFMFKADETRTFDGMFIALKEGLDSGRWVRIRYDYVRVDYFGAQPNDNEEDTEAIQKAIDFSHAFGFPQILIPPGTFLVDSLIIRNGTNIKGHYKGTTLRSYRSSKDSSGSLFKIDRNAVTNVAIENLNLNGNGHEKMCFLIEAVRDNEVHSGLWKSSFRNIEIRNFSSHGIFLKGGDSYSDYSPNQFISFENVRVKRNSVPGTNALRIEGQNAQLSFLNCTFDAQRIEADRPATSWNVYIEKRPEGSAVPAIIKFDTCTIQNAVGAIDIYGAQNISVENCWFENIQMAIRVREGALGINIENNRFANASGFGGQTYGYIVSVEGESVVSFQRNLVAGNYSDLALKEKGSKILASGNLPKKAN
ncbi:MAG: glycosyl hydrolase family 28-related protein, partial [Bacteroidota bacterium]